MNGALSFTIDLLVLTLGVFGSVVFGYIGLKIVRAIHDGRLRAEHLVTDKGSNLFALSKVGQAVGMAALSLGFIYVVTHVKFEDDSVGGWVYWLFAAYGTIMILPQAWTNFLNQNKPLQVGTVSTTDTMTLSKTVSQEKRDDKSE